MNEYEIYRIYIIAILIQSFILTTTCICTNCITNIIKISDVYYNYASVIINLNGDLFIQCLPSQVDRSNIVYKERAFYGLRKNGRPLFYVPENDTYVSMKKLYFDDAVYKWEPETINFKIGDNSNYYFSPGRDDGFSEIYDFNENKAYYTSLTSILGYIKLTRYVLMNSEKGDQFILGYIGTETNTDTNYKLIFQRMKFNTPNISTSIQGSYEQKLLEKTDILANRIVSCLETEKKYIECLIVNNEKHFNVTIYNNSYEIDFFDRLNSSIFDDALTVFESMDLFFKGIHLKKEISAFVYFFDYNSSDLNFYVQIKSLVVENSLTSNGMHVYLENYLKSGEKIKMGFDTSNYYIDQYHNLADLIKINDSKFAFCAFQKEENGVGKDYLFLYIFELINDDKIVVAKFYQIDTKSKYYKLKYNLRLVQFTYYLGLVFSAYDSIENNSTNSYINFLLFSYMNSTDGNFKDLLKYNPTYEFEFSQYINSSTIENNLFNYELINIIIINISSNLNSESGISVTTKKNKTELFSNQVLDLKDGIIIKTINETNGVLFGNYLIEFAGIIREASSFEKTYEHADNSYTFPKTDDITEYTKNYVAKNFTGRHAMFNFTMETCYDSCLECGGVVGNDNYYHCTICKDDVPYNYYGKICYASCYNEHLYRFKRNCLDTCEDNSSLYIDNESMVCYENCTENENTSKIITYKNYCVDSCYKFDYYEYENYCYNKCDSNLFVDEEFKICYTDCRTNDRTNKKLTYKNTCLKSCYENNLYKYGENCYDSCPSDLYTDEISKNCYTSCQNNLNSNRTITLNKKCIEECPEDYEINQNTQFCEKKEYLNCDEWYYFSEENKKTCITYEQCKIQFFKIVHNKECQSNEVKFNEKNYSKCPEKTCQSLNKTSLNICINKTDNMINIGDYCFDSNLNVEEVINKLSDDKIATFNIQNDVKINIYSNKINITNLDKDVTYINLGECGKKIIDYYKLEKSAKLYIMVLDVDKRGVNSSVNDYEFEVYLQNGTFVYNLNGLCGNCSIIKSAPIADKESIKFDIANDFKKRFGYDIYDSKSEFYNDFCAPASIDRNDIIIRDRISDFYINDVDFCNPGCVYNGTNFETERIICICIPNSDEVEEREDLTVEDDNGNLIQYIVDKTNYKVFLCYKLWRKFKKFIKYNYGLYATAACYLISLIDMIIFMLIARNKIKNIFFPGDNNDIDNQKNKKNIANKNLNKKDIQVLNFNPKTNHKSNQLNTISQKLAKNKKKRNLVKKDLCAINLNKKIKKNKKSKDLNNISDKYVNVKRNNLMAEKGFEVINFERKINNKSNDLDNISEKLANSKKKNVLPKKGFEVINFERKVNNKSKDLENISERLAKTKKNKIVKKLSLNKQAKLIKDKQIKENKNLNNKMKMNQNNKQKQKKNNKNTKNSPADSIKNLINKIKIDGNPLDLKSKDQNTNIKSLRDENSKKSKKYKNNKNKKNQYLDKLRFTFSHLISKKDDEEEDDLNDIPYTKALRIDNRNIWGMFYKNFLQKIEIIKIIFFRDDFEFFTVSLNVFILSELLSLFLNALLYSDDVISQKYHSNGELDWITEQLLSLASNFISYLLSTLIGKLIVYTEYYSLVQKEVKIKEELIEAVDFGLTVMKKYMIIFCFLDTIVISVVIYYLSSFCNMYPNSQASFFKDFGLGELQSLILNFVIALVVAIIRKISLKCKNQRLYETSKYIDNFL